MSARSKTVRIGLPAHVAELPLTTQPPALVLFGNDGSGKPRAAWFDAADAEAAMTAAADMRLRALPLTDNAGRDLAGKLARGRILPSGRALVPFAKRDLYARLVALAGEEARLTAAQSTQTNPPGASDASSPDPSAEADAPAAANGGTAAPSGHEHPSGDGGDASPSTGAPRAPRPGASLFVGEPRPHDRSGIGLGSVVLAHEGPDEGWWEAEVIGANGRTFSLRWRDYPTEPTILRKATELALLPPGEA